MLKKCLVAQLAPKANEKNFVYYGNYRVTVLGDKLFRLEQSEKKKFRDSATQAVWFRNMPAQDFVVKNYLSYIIIKTKDCSLILHKELEKVCVEINKEKHLLDNKGNLLGTYRTLDRCDGDFCCRDNPEGNYTIQLGAGVCSKTGIAVLDDSESLSLDNDGQVKPEKADGIDEYIFVYGDDYRGAVQKLYALTGMPGLVPRFALGNWWSRYHAYTDEEYLRLLNRFEDKNVPFSVATVDMDWHYSDYIKKELPIDESGFNEPIHLGDPKSNLGWTGYTWNKNLFPDPKAFLDDIHSRGMKVTLNLHPADGFRWWEDCYVNMAKAMDIDSSKKERIPFDFSYDRFINAYFDIAHTPHEDMGVDFWWLDWQQANIKWHDERSSEEKKLNPLTFNYDPLWALNHYHYLDHASKHSVPLILSRYSGVGSHRYPLGFSGDTEISWKTLKYLPYFTATASNVGYTWWSHDIGGHHYGEKSNELFLRHVQYGVFSPINRLHCTSRETETKEPWAYLGGAGGIIEDFLRFRHKFVPYLYNASYLTHCEGKALIEPLYYEWKDAEAYKFKEEYRFGSELLVIPVTEKLKRDGFAHIHAWLPEGRWTDIFTGDEYDIVKGGKEIVLYRSLESIPVLAKEGAIIPLSADNKNSVQNPERMEIWIYEGAGEYTLYEDDLENGNNASFFMDFRTQIKEENSVCLQTLFIESHGDRSVCPSGRSIKVCFKNVEDGSVLVTADGKTINYTKRFTDRVEVVFPYEPNRDYQITASYTRKTQLEKCILRAKRILTESEGLNAEKANAWEQLLKVATIKEYLDVVDTLSIDGVTKKRLKEIL